MSLFSKQIDKRIAAYQRELIETHYREVDNMYRQIRGWRHDYRNHIQTMKVLAANGDMDAIKLYLDEPTAALDPIAEAAVYENFNVLVEDKTAVFISHRLSSCRFCDNIAVFDHGELVQEGSHDVLVADENGKYSELWHAQAQYYTK